MTAFEHRMKQRKPRYVTFAFTRSMANYPALNALFSLLPTFPPHNAVFILAVRVEINRPMSAAMFDLKFPPNTVFYDESNDKQRPSGSADEIGRASCRERV